MKKCQNVPQGQLVINRRFQPAGITKKTAIFALSLIATVIATMSCDDSKTLQEYIEEERAAIKKYVNMQDIKVLSTYPADSTFAENEYFRTKDGLYFHVVDKGNGLTVKEYIEKYSSAEVLVRFDYFYYVKSFVSKTGADTIYWKNYSNYYGLMDAPMEFRYGYSASYGKYEADLSCDGWAIPLDYVKEGAIVDLIIPSALGTTTDNTGFNAVFYKNLKYTKFY
ncbi:MAG: DUF4827 domain-containing protein [Candidatus Symbiothrix sp.]|jgi:hypothetical protein|nr:DUF4827 domain-containing protein [Candidatus Symbiothrix sp.]